MSKQSCEGCKYSYQYGNPLWSKSELKCKKYLNTSLVCFDRTVNKMDCKYYAKNIEAEFNLEE